MRFETLAVHAGVEPDPQTGAVMTPIYMTSTYAQAAPGQHKGYEYSRTDNPTRSALQAALAKLESGTHALVFSSGMAAIDAVLNLLRAGDHIIAGDDLYGGTYRLFSRVAVERGLEFSFVSLQDESQFRAAIRPNTRLVWMESPTNPMLTTVNIRRTAAIAHEAGALLGVDNTFLSPFNQRPLELGADIVMHSMTKYLNGHSDVVMGCLMMRDTSLERHPEGLFGRLKFLQNSIGAVPSAFDCFLVLRGLKTLGVRMSRHNQNAMELATWLKAHPKVSNVRYPGLPEHPGHTIAASQSTGSGFGGMITATLDTDLEGAKRFLSNLKLFALAESLGGVESLAEHPAIMTHASLPAEVRHSIGIADSLVRFSVGIEALEDIQADLEQALATI